MFNICFKYIYLNNQGDDVTKSNFKQNKSGLKSEFLFKTNCQTKSKEPNMSNNLLPYRRTNEVIPFPRSLVQRKTQIIT